MHIRCGRRKQGMLFLGLELDEGAAIDDIEVGQSDGGRAIAGLYFETVQGKVCLLLSGIANASRFSTHAIRCKRGCNRHSSPGVFERCACNCNCRYVCLHEFMLHCYVLSLASRWKFHKMLVKCVRKVWKSHISLQLIRMAEAKERQGLDKTTALNSYTNCSGL